MLTSRQRQRCAELAETLDAGDQRAWLRAEPSLSPEERGEIWNQRSEVKAMAERRRQGEAAGAAVLPAQDFATRPGRVKTDLASNDLDFWGETPNDDDDDDDDDDNGLPQQETKMCPSCRGLGRTKDGSRCSRCNGLGRVPLTDVTKGGTSFYGFEDED
jgi:hypothetical protein